MSEGLEKETTFTRGPWTPSIFGFQVLTGDSWNSICELKGDARWQDDEHTLPRDGQTQLANAHLIASAPELYEALTLIKRFGELACVDAGLGLGGSSGKKPASKDVFQFPRHLLADIDAALLKARGEDRSHEGK